MKTFAEILPDLLAGKLCEFKGGSWYRVQLEGNLENQFRYSHHTEGGWNDGSLWDDMEIDHADLTEAKWTVVA